MVVTDQKGDVRIFRLARTMFGRGLYFTGAYLVDGLMVDTGCSYTARELVESLGESRVQTIVNTHSHEDHIGANAALQARFRAEVLVHPGGLAFLSEPRRLRLRPYQRFFWGYPEASMGNPLGESVSSEHHRFHVIHTPGHSSDHVCLYEPKQGWLFTGDAYVGGKDRVLRADFVIWQIIGTLKKLAKLDVELLFTGSGSVRKNGRQELINKIDYLEGLGQRVLDLHARGWSYRRIRKKLFGPQDWIAYVTLGHYGGWNLVRSYVEDGPKGQAAESLNSWN